ncbi:MAG TPA: type II toxin-antitoxin system PemK/MazF family toxin [Firmicutes bacterium]|nr:type II toxin-antitoxin system PemK/MazF family toxin [Bacillota bacterium]
MVRRGEIWLVDWNPGQGSEQAGMRPALVIQNDIGNRHSPTTIVAAISSAPPAGLSVPCADLA